MFLLAGISGCAEPRRHWTTDLEKQERELLIKRDMVTAPEREMIDQQLKRIQNEWYFDIDEDKSKPAERSKTEEEVFEFNKNFEKQIHEQQREQQDK